tara:strand:- start:2779 stop:3150 length:372 start_codon:yes stop_codon:yes gene_type:complete
MFEQFTKLVFTLLNEMRTLETTVNTHGRDINGLGRDINGLEQEISLLKEIATDNKETNRHVNESLERINKSLCPILNKNRKLDKIWGYMGWIGMGSAVFTVIATISLLIMDAESLISLIAKLK